MSVEIVNSTSSFPIFFLYFLFYYKISSVGLNFHQLFQMYFAFKLLRFISKINQPMTFHSTRERENIQTNTKLNVNLKFKTNFSNGLWTFSHLPSTEK